MNKGSTPSGKKNCAAVDGAGVRRWLERVGEGERSSCGVGFVVSLDGERSHSILQAALEGLACVEHRGACSADDVTGDGTGLTTEIPFDLLGIDPESHAVASLLTPSEPDRRETALRVFRETFRFFGLEVVEIREVPRDEQVLGPIARSILPGMVQAYIKRPEHCRTRTSFDKLLYVARQHTRIKQRENGIYKEFFFVSLSTHTIIYKALTRSEDLARFYPDLRNPRFMTRYALFHRRFSTNTITAWDKVQPFRLIAHNGEINTISGNRSWSYSREKDLGLREDELLTQSGISDTGSLNEMVEALLYRSTLTDISEVLSITMPPAGRKEPFYKLWSRGLEPWDGPALVAFTDGTTIGARLDRNGFRPCRWVATPNRFYLSSEAGTFRVDEAEVVRKGSLGAGRGVKVNVEDGRINFLDASMYSRNRGATFDARLVPCVHPSGLSPRKPVEWSPERHQERLALFMYAKEDVDDTLAPMAVEGKEPIGSMGDTAPPAILSSQPRSLFDYFYQNFAQVTNPPLDYIREEMVTDLTTYLGRKPNVFKPTALIPPPIAIELESPVLSLELFESIRARESSAMAHDDLRSAVLDISYDRSHGAGGLQLALDRIERQAIERVTQGVSILVLSDERASFERLAVPSLLALRVVVNRLNQEGLKLEASIVMHSAEVRSTHQLAALIGFGASAVCPWLAMETVREESNRAWNDLDPGVREGNLKKAMEQGLLKIMAKMGISVSRSYQSSKLFTAIGLGPKLVEAYFPGLVAHLGGLEIEDIASRAEEHAQFAEERHAEGGRFRSYTYKEHPRGKEGERHGMTAARSKLIHRLVRETGLGLDDTGLYEEYLKLEDQAAPVNVRDLLALRRADAPLAEEQVEPAERILPRFGSGAMSFGAISAESQRDIFEAMREIGGRSNSGEGGENPFYFTNGISASAKQVASARFGVTAEYLMAGKEYQIKIAQGAKPGEGGQLMGVKVSEEIARARYAMPGTDLISPPPLHDIYSIEDLKELIYELRQLNPAAKVNVKLVSGAHIGMIAVGVAKAGADIIHVSGGNGGTGAASVSSMRHAGLPWEFGLLEVHNALKANGLRDRVTLRVDGGLSTGRDLVIGAVLGAQEFEFGKLLLIAEGCVMARICEKNTCPTGIATHDPKFAAKYKGQKEHVVNLMRILARDVRRNLALMGFDSLEKVVGRTDLLRVNPAHKEIIAARRLDLSDFVTSNEAGCATEAADSVAAMLATFQTPELRETAAWEDHGREHSPLNARILRDSGVAENPQAKAQLRYEIRATDRAVPAALCGVIADHVRNARLEGILSGRKPEDARGYEPVAPPAIRLDLAGSAGQGFGVFLTKGIDLRLRGEANDSVGKSMSGGQIVIRPSDRAKFVSHENAIIGNVALYGATGGRLFVNGLAGDRFAVRNSGAQAVVEGVGLHACEYMTGGVVVILGGSAGNIGAGMTGGRIFLYGGRKLKTQTGEARTPAAKPGHAHASMIHSGFITSASIGGDDAQMLRVLLMEHAELTGSQTAGRILDDWDTERRNFSLFIPRREAERIQEEEKVDDRE